jgi:hypothetical protein
MSKARELAELGAAYDSGALSNRNIIINGAMNVSQRATSSTGVGGSSGYFTCDRWKITTDATAGRVTMTQESDGPDGFANSIKLATTTADTSIAAGELFILGQSIEAQDLQKLKKGTSAAESVTVSFYVKANASATYVAELYDHDNTRNNTRAFTVGTDWSRVELTFAADTTGALGDDNAAGMTFQIWLHAGSTYSGGTFSDNTWQSVTAANRYAGSRTSIFDSTSRTLFITGVQLEVGTEATPFEHRTFHDEFQRCSRYYQHSNGTGVKPTNGSDATSFGTGYRALAPVNMWGGSTAGRVWEMVRSAPMRATPTGTKFGNDSGYYGCIVHGSTSAPNADNSLTFHENLMLRTEDSCFISFDNQSSGNTVWGVMGGFELDAEL